jgi:excisionase family DNA binding protein
MPEQPKRATNLSPSLDLFTATEAAAILGVSIKLVRTWIKEGALPATRLGPGQRLYRIRRADLEAFIDARQFPLPSELRSQGNSRCRSQ